MADLLVRLALPSPASLTTNPALFPRHVPYVPFTGDAIADYFARC